MLRWADADQKCLNALMAGYRLTIVESVSDQDIPGSFWGDEEAGLIGNKLYIRDDTPIHSLLHEACHFICMDPQRRKGLDTNAGGDYDEENAVCYLQILLADQVPGFSRKAAFKDMDEWGYSFRLGSTQAWFDGDAEDARNWLLNYKLINRYGSPSFLLRESL